MAKEQETRKRRILEYVDAIARGMQAKLGNQTFTAPDMLVALALMTASIAKSSGDEDRAIEFFLHRLSQILDYPIPPRKP